VSGATFTNARALQRLGPGHALVCSCPRGRVEPRFDNGSDAFTGTAYAECRWCGTQHPTSRGAWVDWSMGVAMDSRYVIGSAWTSGAAKGYFADLSRLSART